MAEFTTIKSLFQTMELEKKVSKQPEKWYGEFGDVDPGRENDYVKERHQMLSGHTFDVLVAKPVAIEYIATKIHHSSKKSTDRAEILDRFVIALEKNETEICEIDANSKDLLASSYDYDDYRLMVDYFRYYAGLARVNLNTQNKPKVSIILQCGVPLSVLGCVLGAALISHTYIILHITPMILPFYLKNLLVENGLDKNELQIVPRDKIDVKELHTYFDNFVVLGDLSIWNGLSAKNTLFMSTQFRTPMIIFENCDVDSAVNCAIKAVWGQDGTLHWNVDTIIIQENIFEKFYEKLKQQLSMLLAKFQESSTKRKVDRCNYLLDLARKQKIEVYPNVERVSHYEPILFIGEKIDDDNGQGGSAVLLTFRTINEGIALVNNEPGFAATVWTENLSLANEVVRKLKVSNIWINCFGIFHPSVPIYPHNYPSNCILGGKECLASLNGNYFLASEKVPSQVSKEIQAHLLKMKVEQKKWMKLSRFKRIGKLTKICGKVQNGESNAETYKELIDYLRFSMSSCEMEVIQDGKYDMKYYVEPCGLVLIESDENWVQLSMKLIFCALLEGNAVFVLNSHKNSEHILQLIVDVMGSDLFYVYNGHLDLLENNAVDKFFMNELTFNLNNKFIHNLSKYVRIIDTPNLLKKVVNIKNVWSAVGQSIL